MDFVKLIESAAAKQVVEGAAASSPEGFFHPSVPIGEDASDMDKMLASSGRAPSWS